MSEKILSIEELQNYRLPWQAGDLTFHSEMDGWRVTTDAQDILFLIDNSQDCGDAWGYACSDDNPSDFIGAILLEVRLTDEARRTPFMAKIDSGSAEFRYGGAAQFVDFITDRGLLQFAVYNEHNGNYSHSVYIQGNGMSVTRYI